LNPITRILFVVLAVVGFLASSRACVAQPCDRVLCYFSGLENAIQWRIYDPVRCTDRLFLELPGEASVRWDSSLSRVEYRVGRELFRADWKLGVRPRRVAVFPELPAIEDWWFNPDSSRWQFYTMAPLAETPNRHAYEDCRAELWQSSRDGMDWHLVVADTESCADWYHPMLEEGARWNPVCASHMRRLPTVTSDDLAPAISGDSDGAELVEDSSPECDEPLYYAPSRTVAGRGVLFRYLSDAAPEPTRPLYPVHWVDRKHGKRVLLCGPDVNCPDEITPVHLTEECGLLLVECTWDTRLVDVASGQDVKLVGSSSGLRAGAIVLGIAAFWGPRLRP